MSTIGEALDAAEQRLFVGRARELELFDEWLTAAPPLLVVNGRGGVGKTTLLRAFRRHAARRGWEVLSVDGATIPPTPGAFMAVAEKVDGGSILMVDAFEHVEDLTDFLQEEFLPVQEAGTKVVLASRRPLGRSWAPWSELIQTINLAAWSRQDLDAYLDRRGIPDPRANLAIWERTFGHPLAVSLAADLVQREGVERLGTHGDWRASVRELVEQLLDDVADPRLRHLLEGAAMVRQFDEPTLAAITGEAGVSDVFGELCRLSVVRAGEHGLMLHEDVRRLISEDLKWRDRDQYDRYRAQARSYYTQREHGADNALSGHLLVEELFLSEIELIHDRVFRDDNREAWVDPHPRLADVRAVFERWVEFSARMPAPPPAEELSWELWERLSRFGNQSVMIARDVTDEAVAAGFMMPIVTELVEQLPAGPMRSFIESWRQQTGARIPDRAREARAWYLSTIARGDESADVPMSTLTRECTKRMAANEGEYLVLTREPLYAQLVQLTGFYPIWEEQGATAGLTGYHVDLDALGREAFIRSVVANQVPPQSFRGPALEQQVELVLTHWHDKQVLDRNGLGLWVRFHSESDVSPGEAIVGLVGQLLSERHVRSDDERLALEAVVRGFVDTSLTQEAAARRLSVSRATYYRLRRRGIEILARDIWRMLAA